MRRPDLREELGNDLQIALGTGLIGGGLLGFLAAAATLALNPPLLRSAGDVLRLLLGLQIVYALLCLALGLLAAGIKTAIFLRSGRSLSDTKAAAVVTWAVFFILSFLYALAWCRWLKIGGMSPDHPPGWRQAPLVLGLASVSALLASLLSTAFYILIVYVKKPARRGPHDLRRAFLVLLYMGAAFVLFVAILRVSSSAPGERSGLTQDKIDPRGRRVCLLGIDGMGAQDLEWARRRGLIPWAGFLDSARRAPVQTPVDPVPPMLWTLVATGRDPAAHGVLDYQAQVVRGLSTPLRIGPNQVGVFDLFHTVLPFFHLTRTVPVKSYMRESKGLWNMASDAGKRTVAVNWWVSWPAERVFGAVVSDHAWLKLAGEPAAAHPGEPGSGGTFASATATVQTLDDGVSGAMSPLRPDGRPLLLERETWPNTLLIELSSWAQPTLPDSISRRFGPLPGPEATAVFRELGIPVDVLSSDLFYTHAAAGLLDRQHPDLWMLHLPGPDILRRVLQKRVAAPAQREAARLRALDAYWRTLSPALEACTREAQEQGDLICGLFLPGHPWADAESQQGGGLFALSGGGMTVESLGSALQPSEIAPTVLWLLGLPASREMDGSPRLDLAGPELAAGLAPVRWIPSYGRQETEGLEEAAGTLDQEMIERFKSLGYIR